MDINNRHIRQTDLVSEKILSTPITIIGAGSIGSFTTLALAKCGFHDLTVFDYDKIEEHNISNQFYPLNAVGIGKIDALLSMIHEFEGIKISGMEDEYRKEDGKGQKGIVISAVDSMSSRKTIYESIRRNKDVIAFIDGRMGGQQLEVYTAKLDSIDDKKCYVSTLWTDEETEDTRCTEKAVIYNVLLIAGMIVNQCRLVLEDKDYMRQIIMHLDTMQMINITGEDIKEPKV